MAKRDIAEGEEISDFYGEHFFQSDKWSRKAALGFPCACPACREGWPLLDQLPRLSVEEAEHRLESSSPPSCSCQLMLLTVL